MHEDDSDASEVAIPLVSNTAAAANAGVSSTSKFKHDNSPSKKTVPELKAEVKKQLEAKQSTKKTEAKAEPEDVADALPKSSAGSNSVKKQQEPTSAKATPKETSKASKEKAAATASIKTKETPIVKPSANDPLYDFGEYSEKLINW